MYFVPKPTMRTIEIAIAEKAGLLQEAIASVVSSLQHRMTLRVSTLSTLLERLNDVTARPHICIVNITEPESLLSISMLKESYPSMAIIAYSHDEGNIDVGHIMTQVDYYLYASDSVAILNRAIVKSYLRYR